MVETPEGVRGSEFGEHLPGVSMMRNEQGFWLAQGGVQKRKNNLLVGKYYDGLVPIIINSPAISYSGHGLKRGRPIPRVRRLGLANATSRDGPAKNPTYDDWL